MHDVVRTTVGPRTDRRATVARLLSRGLDVEPPRPSPVVARLRPAFASRSVDVHEEHVRAAASLRPEFTMADVLDALHVPADMRDRSIVARIGRTLARLGWRPVAQRGHGARERVYRRST